MKRSRTAWLYEGKPYTETCGTYCGFVYLVECHHPNALGKRYIGRRFFFTKWNTKTLRKETPWQTYKTSSKYVQAAIAEYGEEYFTFEIIALYKTKAGVVNGEVAAQWAADVLHATKKDGTRLYWNEAIGGIRFIAKEKFTAEHRAKIAAAKTGKRHSEETKEKIRRAYNPLPHKGRPSHNQKIEDCQVLQVFELAAAGVSRAETSRRIGCYPTTISNICLLKSPRYKALYEQFQSNHH